MRLKTSSFVLLLLVVLAAGCADRTVKMYTANIPVYKSFSEWRSEPMDMQAAKSIVTPGRIYVYRNLLIVNEFMRGVHIFDNSVPASPVDLGFLPVIANIDIAVRDNIMYLDSYTDLLAFDISDARHPKLVNRLQDVLTLDKMENLCFVEGFNPQYPLGQIDMSQGVVVGWTVGEIKDDDIYKDFESSFAMNGMQNFRGGTGTGKTANFSSNGIAASTARFAIQDHYLYALNDWRIKVFDIQSGIVAGSTVDAMSAGYPETIFPADGNLFIGTTMGMCIYSLSNPASPMFLSQYDHGTGCDPVVVQGDVAFVTLSTGRNCPGIANVLDVVDISNLSAPRLLYSFNMTNPKGLGVDGNTLFLCDGEDGLKVFDKTDLATMDQHLTKQFDNIVTNDVIPMGDVLLMTGAAGIYQYDYTDLRNIQEISLIPVGH